MNSTTLVRANGDGRGYECACGYESGVASHIIEHIKHMHPATPKSIVDQLRGWAAEEQRQPASYVGG